MCVVRNFKEPLRQFTLLNKCAGAPAASINHLLIGENGLINGIPIDLRGLAINQTVLQEVEKHSLLMLVIGRIAGRDFTVPIERKPHAFKLRAHGCYIGVSPCRRMGFVGHGCIFCWHAERVPTHRMQDIETACALIARYHVTHGVIAHMAHMNAARWIGKHFKDVVFWSRIVVFRTKKFFCVPDLLPFPLSFAGVVTLGSHVNSGIVSDALQ